MLDQVTEVKKDFDKDISLVDSLKSLSLLRLRYVGKGGVLKKLFASANAMEGAIESLRHVNQLSCYVSSAIQKKQKLFQEKVLQDKLDSQKLDVTYPARDSGCVGNNHLIIQTTEEAVRIFNSMGFCAVEGPELEDEYHVFDALNTPSHHPARQMQDSFYLEGGRMLRTHTSSVQVRIMKDSRPPFRIVSVGRVYRNDWDATHSPMFHQIEGLCIDENTSMSCMRSCIENFLQEFFGQVKFRMRPSYFPFTEPSAEIDIARKNSDWLEVLGCGMVHPSVLQNVGVDATKYTGFAFGMGVERIAMLKYNVSDLRNFFSCDLRWKVV